ncbi:LysM peptidoglycan-binding domain-containing protein [Arthrobacter sp. zg-Y844]|uniref:LysM peptidoglycan-binding domain-containing protein n=1 Tax=Arthrobacter sp. zg-Y844 TaxID=2964612 RepID=UPI0021047B8D|nr:LysM peptidoglycan-binding domain-containing protein [Arthrobacter sp. zg-Y844]MCQ1987990.1 LysM peptidoglycan-binding domain-containing protein [Arthrobacter sp. zg-Y844]
MSVHVLPLTAQSITAQSITAQSLTGSSPDRAAGPARMATTADAQASVPLRLTRRGRLVLVGAPLMIVAAALLAFIGFFTAPAMASGDSPEQTRTIQVGVSAGDSLWSLATEFAPDRDPRTVVADIVELNNLADATVPAGSQIYIPVSR